jgi:hypothetical protein
MMSNKVQTIDFYRLFVALILLQLVLTKRF